MAKPTYIVMKDQPVPNAYGQYVYDAMNMLPQTGLDTLDISDDLYSIKGSQFNVSDNFYTSFPFGGGRIQIEPYPLFSGAPEGHGGIMYFKKSRMRTYFFDGAITVPADFNNYTAVRSLVTGLSNYFYTADKNTEEGGSVSFSDAYSYGGWSDMWDYASPSGWYTPYEYPQTWFSLYGGGSINFWDEDYYNAIVKSRHK